MAGEDDDVDGVVVARARADAGGRERGAADGVANGCDMEEPNDDARMQRQRRRGFTPTTSDVHEGVVFFQTARVCPSFQTGAIWKQQADWIVC